MSSLFVVFVSLSLITPGQWPATRSPAPDPIEEGARQETGNLDHPVARVNGVVIRAIDFENAVDSFAKDQGLPPNLGEDRARQVKQVVLDGLIGSELLHQKALSIPIQVEPKEVDDLIATTRQGMGEEGFQAELQRRRMSENDVRRLVRQNLMVQKLIQDIVVTHIDITSEEIEAFYGEHRSEIGRPERVEASHILVKSAPGDPPAEKEKARRRIQEAQRRAQSGEDFAWLARQYSDDATAASGGEIGTIQRGQTIPSLEQAAFKLNEGEVSDVVESQHGYHLIKVTRRAQADTATLAEARDTIAQYLKQKKAQDAVEELVRTLRAEAKVEIY